MNPVTAVRFKNRYVRRSNRIPWKVRRDREATVRFSGLRMVRARRASRNLKPSESIYSSLRSSCLEADFSDVEILDEPVSAHSTVPIVIDLGGSDSNTKSCPKQQNLDKNRTSKFFKDGPKKIADNRHLVNQPKPNRLSVESMSMSESKEDEQAVSSPDPVKEKLWIINEAVDVTSIVKKALQNIRESRIKPNSSSDSDEIIFVKSTAVQPCEKKQEDQTTTTGQLNSVATAPSIISDISNGSKRKHKKTRKQSRDLPNSVGLECSASSEPMQTPGPTSEPGSPSGLVIESAFSIPNLPEDLAPLELQQRLLAVENAKLREMENINDDPNHIQLQEHAVGSLENYVMYRMMMENGYLESTNYSSESPQPEQSPEPALGLPIPVICPSRNDLEGISYATTEQRSSVLTPIPNAYEQDIVQHQHTPTLNAYEQGIVQNQQTPNLNACGPSIVQHQHTPNLNAYEQAIIQHQYSPILNPCKKFPVQQQYSAILNAYEQVIVHHQHKPILQAMVQHQQQLDFFQQPIGGIPPGTEPQGSNPMELCPAAQTCLYCFQGYYYCDEQECELGNDCSCYHIDDHCNKVDAY